MREAFFSWLSSDMRSVFLSGCRVRTSNRLLSAAVCETQVASDTADDVTSVFCKTHLTSKSWRDPSGTSRAMLSSVLWEVGVISVSLRVTVSCVAFWVFLISDGIKLSSVLGGVTFSSFVCGVILSLDIAEVIFSLVICGLTSSSFVCEVTISAFVCGVTFYAFVCGVTFSSVICGVIFSSVIGRVEFSSFVCGLMVFSPRDMLSPNFICVFHRVLWLIFRCPGLKMKADLFSF